MTRILPIVENILEGISAELRSYPGTSIERWADLKVYLLE
jgi:hypothetical protein